METGVCGPVGDAAAAASDPAAFTADIWTPPNGNILILLKAFIDFIIALYCVVKCGH